MFVGVAGAIRKRLGVPVVCELTGEDIFLDAMAETYRAKLRELIRQRAADVTRFVSATRYYADRMAEYLDVARDRIEVIHTGIAPDLLAPIKPRDAEGSRPHIVGYLARVCPEKGLDRLVDAMLVLREKSGFEDAKLRAAGYLGPRDQKWFDQLKQRVDASPLRGSFEFLGEVDRAGKIAMLDSIDVFSVPTAYPEAKGISILEAMARGVPVVQPAHGSFPELIDQTGGGVLVTPNDPGALADAIGELLRDPVRRSHLGAAGRSAIESRFTEDQMAERTLSLYKSLS
jgi:glycosyltransferase involved in cell wall biosynthesis